jgi:hypothetical protein
MILNRSATGIAARFGKANLTREFFEFFFRRTVRLSEEKRFEGSDTVSKFGDIPRK